LVVSASGIRGIVFEALNPEICSRLASAFAGLLGTGKYVVGRDTRPSGDILAMAVAGGLRAVGSDVVDVGICPTPTIQIAVERHSAAGGIAVTASHNTAEWNALKLISSSGTFLPKSDVDAVIAAFKSRGVKYVGHDRLGLLDADAEAGEYHLSEVLALPVVESEGVRERGYTVAVDCTNGAGADIVPELLRRLGCVVRKLDCRPDGRFRRNPEPLAENLGELCRMVRAEGADIGFALDPDADRLAVVDEQGRALGEDYTLVVCADCVLRRYKGPVVANLSTTMALGNVADRHGVGFFRAPVGEINVVERMKQVEAAIGGEGNGGVILPALHYGRDALVGIALVLTFMCEGGKPLSELMKQFPKYDIVKRKLGLDYEFDPELVREKLEKEFAGCQVNTDDGIRIDMGDGWVHLRRSGTEPAIRLISEAKDSKASNDLIDRVLKVLSG
jgi:phosphomannomutase